MTNNRNRPGDWPIDYIGPVPFTFQACFLISLSHSPGHEQSARSPFLIILLERWIESWDRAKSPRNNYRRPSEKNRGIRVTRGDQILTIVRIKGSIAGVPSATSLPLPRLITPFTTLQRLASELVFIDVNEELAKAEAEDISHGAAFLGNPKIIGTKGTNENKYLFYSVSEGRMERYTVFPDYSLARDATVCVITIGDRSTNEQDPSTLLEQNLNIFKDVIPKVCKYAPNSILLIVTAPGTLLFRLFILLSRTKVTRVTTCRFSRHSVVRGHEALGLPTAPRRGTGHVFGQL